MRQGRVWKMHPLGAVAYQQLQGPALHETRLSLGLQSKPSNAWEKPREKSQVVTSESFALIARSIPLVSPHTSGPSREIILESKIHEAG
jgi:hypothetical protein